MAAKKHIPHTDSRVGKGTKLKGDLRFDGSLRVSGAFEGTVQSTGLLFVDKEAQVKGDIEAGYVTIAGVIDGNVHAPFQVDILASAKIYGNIRTRKMRIADGAIFEGRCEMVKGSEGYDMFHLKGEDLRLVDDFSEAFELSEGS